MPFPQRFIARCFDPTCRWPGRLRAALDSTQWNIVNVDTVEELLPPDGSPALLLCVLSEQTESEIATWWSMQRQHVHPRSPLVVVANSTDDAGLVAYWQELGAATVLTTTLDLPLVVQLAERFAANPYNLAADQEHPLTPFWNTLPWSSSDAVA